jgi:hypothetical protein
MKDDMKLRKFIATTIREFLTEQIQLNPTTLTDIINNTASKWKSNKRMTIKQINNGYCMDFAEDVVNKIGFENSNSGFHRVYSEYLYDYDDLGFYDEEQIFDDETLSKWNKSSVNQYGGLPNIENIEEYEPDTHVWLYFNGKHYDVENPNGVNKWYELDFYKRDLAKFLKSF